MQTTIDVPTVPQSRRVHALLSECLYETAPADTVPVTEGIVLRIGFDPAAVEQNRPKIEALINEIVPDEFYEGMSFARLCLNRQGTQWGGHRDMDALLCLALAIGRATILLPRALWAVMPAGLPYIRFFKQQEKVGG